MQKILITGATGFLGGAVTGNLLKKGQINNLLLLVRGETPEEGLERVKKNLAKFGLNSILLDSLTPQQILPGDLSEPEHFTADPRLDDVTHVLNCAAVASFGNNPWIWKVNVEGTFKFASRMSRVSGLKRFVHVGTAMSCAPRANSLVTESERATSRQQHIVEYTWSKATIERMMMESLACRPDGHGARTEPGPAQRLSFANQRGGIQPAGYDAECSPCDGRSCRSVNVGVREEAAGEKRAA
ncbi:SDR family oxidoreductase [Pantoea sp. App145]|uniref:SDR family oxidoreductase n=1 Tax=Pantoea sp. App145 TaxID=3071567 RepID=UPI003A7FC2E7